MPNNQVRTHVPQPVADRVTARRRAERKRRQDAEKRRRITPVWKSADPWFNQVAAKKVYDLVMKMDADAVAPFAIMVMTDVLHEEIAKNHRTLERHLNEVVAKRKRRLETVLDKMVAKGETDVLRAALEQVSKARLTPWDYGYIFDENDFRRDQQGRFTTKVTYVDDDDVRPLSRRDTERIPSMPHVEGRGVPAKVRNADDRAKARYQQGYMQVANFLNAVAARPDQVDEVIHVIRDTNANRLFYKKGNGTEIPDIDPSYEEFIGVEVIPKKTKDSQVDLATFGLVSSLGGIPMQATHAANQMATLDRELPNFATDWAGAGSEGEALGSTNARLYGRIGTGAQYLSLFQDPGSQAWMATKLAQFVGQRGPEAEKVLGPSIRRAAYRFRGIEKKPEAEIVEAYNAKRGLAATQLSAEDEQRIKVAQGRAVGAFKRREKRDPTKEELASIRQGVRAQAMGVEAKTPEEAAEYLSVRGRNALIETMFERIPDASYYDLQLKAGHTPPSEGLIVNRKGDLVTQAVGYADDHYLPFNLANLKGLKEGSYIRTRSVGGPTTEDIYTGLMAGARQIIVVSRSGGFIVEFEDDFRGTRRYNDKAARMVKRYGKILDAVQSQQATRQPIEPSVRRKIREDVMRSMVSFSPKERADEIKRREDEYRSYPTVSQEDRDKIEARAKQIEATGDLSGAAQYRKDALNEELERKAFVWKLNGDGYDAALRSLREQFPYYIKDVRYIQREHLATYASEPDRGYVKARHLRPHDAKEGYFDTSIAGESEESAKDKKKLKPHGKTSADRVNYQNWKHNPSNVSRPAAAPTPEAGEGAPAAGATPAVPGRPARPGTRSLTPEEQAVERLNAERRAEASAQAALRLRRYLTAPGRIDAADPVRTNPRFREIWRGTDDQFVANYPRLSGAFGEMIDELSGDTTTAWNDAERVALAEYEVARGTAGGVAFDRAQHLDVVRPTRPFTWNESAYIEGADVALRNEEMDRLNSETMSPLPKPLAEYDDADFPRALELMRNLRRSAELASSAPDRRLQLEALQRSGYMPAVEEELARLVGSEDPAMRARLNDFTENIHRYWALRNRQSADLETQAAMPDVEPPAPSGPSATPTPGGPSTPGPAPTEPTNVRVVRNGRITQVAQQNQVQRRKRQIDALHERAQAVLLSQVDQHGPDSPQDHLIGGIVQLLERASEHPMHPGTDEIPRLMTALIRRFPELEGEFADLEIPERLQRDEG